MFSIKACNLCNLDLLKPDFEISRTTSGLTSEANCKFTIYFSVANPLVLCAPPQLLILTERTRSDLAISPTRSGVTTSKQKQAEKFKLACRIFLLYLVHNVWLFVTYQTTLRRNGAIG